MYAFIQGQVCEKNSGNLVILAGGVGYQIMCSMNTISQSPAVGEEMRCYTYLSVREDAMELYGFATKEEKSLFMSLISVNGVGAKMALAILGSMPVRDLNMAILLGDVQSLTRAPGVGKKTAQRIALELKDKVVQSDVDSGSTAGVNKQSQAGVNPDELSDALEALISLGYSGTEARDALMKAKSQCAENATTEELIRLSLREMAGVN